MPVDTQIDALRLYLRTLRADVNRASRDEYVAYRKRRICPFVETLRHSRLSRAYELEAVAQECLAQLRHVQALSASALFPGDQITIEFVMGACKRPTEHAVIYDVEWSKHNHYHYVMWQVTKGGQLFKRGTTWLSVSKYVRILPCNLPLPDETRRQCDYFRDRACEFVAKAVLRGKIEDIIKTICERRARRGF